MIVLPAIGEPTANVAALVDLLVAGAAHKRAATLSDQAYIGFLELLLAAATVPVAVMLLVVPCGRFGT